MSSNFRNLSFLAPMIRIQNILKKKLKKYRNRYIKSLSCFFTHFGSTYLDCSVDEKNNIGIKH